MTLATNALIALHGFSENGAVLRAHLDGLMRRVPNVELIGLDAPHLCADASLERMRRGRGRDLPPGPWRCWWDATDDGAKYRGLEQSLDVVRAALTRYPGAGVLGFSQGAILGAAIAALSNRGDLPPISYVILVAGRTPRAKALRGAFGEPIAVPSLHVWGEKDGFAVAESPILAECFAPCSRRTVIWPGPHVVPTRGPAADAIVEFIEAGNS